MNGKITKIKLDKIFVGSNLNIINVGSEGTPIPSRSLPPSTNLQFRDIYQVAKPFPVQASAIAPYYGMPGMGTQYLTPLPIQNMVNKGILIRITIPIP